MSRHTPTLLALVQGYFQDHLPSVRGASPHTIRSYRDSLRLFVLFASQRLDRPVAELRLDDVNSGIVLPFLDHLETKRSNGITTRNCRLAAIHSFVSHLLRHDVTRAEQYRQVLAIPSKRARSQPPCYLEPEEARALIDRVEPKSAGGARDLALLLFLYNTGARVSEALAVTLDALQLRQPYQVRLHGKGRKDRVCPLWPETARALRALLEHNKTQGPEIFRNVRGAPLTRDGVAYIIAKHLRCAAREFSGLRDRRVTPHVLRHSCATALLQSGAPLTVIRDYLGHVSVSTTNRYLSSNLNMKRLVLESFWKRAGLARLPRRPWRPTANLLAFLDSL